MNYGGIPKKVLKIVLGEDYFNGDYSLQSELDRYAQDIEFARWNVNKAGNLEFFHAWTKDYTMSLCNDLMGDRIVLGLFRNPPEALYELGKKKKKRK